MQSYFIVFEQTSVILVCLLLPEDHLSELIYNAAVVVPCGGRKKTPNIAYLGRYYLILLFLWNYLANFESVCKLVR